MRIAVVGTGFVSHQYARTLCAAGAELLCYDLHHRRQQNFAAQWAAEEVHDLATLKECGISVALNLTPPAVHADVSGFLLRAGVPVYSEKPLATTLAIARELAAVSAQTGVPLACAPDTFLGETEQHLRALLDQGVIGRPLWISGFAAHRGHEKWHPRAQFFFQHGAGPVFDLGPYWLSAMVHLLGSVNAVTAIGYTPPLRRTYRQDEGKVIEIVLEVPTSCNLLLEFATGPRASLLLSFDLHFSAAPALEVFGDEGSLMVRDPLYTGQGPVLYRSADTTTWEILSPARPRVPWRRGIGVLEFVESIRSTGRSRVGPELALHLMEIMEAATTALQTGGRILVRGTVQRPEPYGGPCR